MSIISRVRHSVGLRLLIGFWATLLAAILCIWLVAQWQKSDVEIARVDSQDIRLLDAAKQRTLRAFNRVGTIEGIKDLLANSRKGRVVLYDVGKQRVLSPPSRFKRRLDRDVNELIEQSTPIKISRPPYQLIGPVPLQLAGKDFLLFVQRPGKEGLSSYPNAPYFIILVLLIMSVLFSVFFTRSIVTPIRELYKTSQQLANGDWRARVSEKQCKKDEIGQLATGFNTMADKLAQNWQGQQRLLADVSHELRSPLTRLNMAVALAEQAAKDNAVIKTALLRIEQETAVMEEMIGKVLTLSRAEAAMAKKEDLSLLELLEPVLSNAEFEASQLNKSFTVSAIPNITVHVQRDAVQSGIENVIRNAIRHAKGRIDVQLSEVANEHQPCWCVTVTDDGSGLAEDDLQHIFSPFYRAERARDRKSGGVGLGLAIAKAVVTAHHGNIEATNHSDGGLKVSLSFSKRS
ncbi:HAMP domain-containing protein [Alteromonas sediminis]|uniref:histidine kinase n=1 Tax=Alteromonas sediminis TaxID=2259342 RepID=A0A3N5Y0F1_9ALTE|nr:ATP-binding protein [Alteromonas sediminis]RPJ66353.1 HAMP domain-containing protein [Alteromonas sediminis]